MLSIYHQLLRLCCLPQKALLVVVLMCVGCVSPFVNAETGPSPVLDYRIKAAMLYKFLSYTDWPEAAFPTNQTPYRICVLGSSTMADELRTTVAGRQINGRSIEVDSANSVDQLASPHMVFITRDMETQLENVASSATRQSFLVVTDNDQGLAAGSTINLRLINGRIGFDISLLSAQKAHLKLSARLLSVASTVEEVNHR